MYYQRYGIGLTRSVAVAVVFSDYVTRAGEKKRKVLLWIPEHFNKDLTLARNLAVCFCNMFAKWSTLYCNHIVYHYKNKRV